MINKLFQSLSSRPSPLPSSPKAFTSITQFIIEIYSKISEAILQMHFDRNNLKQFSCQTDQASQMFQLSLKKIYKTQELLREKSPANLKSPVFLEIFIQFKTSSKKYLLERWTIFSEGALPSQEGFSSAYEQVLGKASIFIRSLLCLICTTPFWKLYSTKTIQNSELTKKTFLDYSLFFETKNKSVFEGPPQKVQEREISLEFGQFRVKLILEYIRNLTWLLDFEKPSGQIRLDEKANKRGRFLSEGFKYNLENNTKSDNSTNDSGVNNSGIMRWDSDNMSNKQSVIDDHKTKKRKGCLERQRNLMSRKDSLILQSNNNERNIKVFDDDGQEIEVEYVDQNPREANDFVMHTIKEQEKEDNDYVIKEKNFRDDLFEQDDDYVIVKISPEPVKDSFIENLQMKISEMKKLREKSPKKERKNLKEEMNEISRFYLSLVGEEKNDN